VAVPEVCVPPPVWELVVPVPPRSVELPPLELPPCDPLLWDAAPPPRIDTRTRLSTSFTPDALSAMSSIACFIRRSGTVPSMTTAPLLTSIVTSLESM
jgi:hypothetical protein